MIQNINGTIRVWIKVFDDKNVSYSSSIYKKDKDGKAMNAYFPVFFSKNVNTDEFDITGREYIDILLQSAWLTPYKKKDSKYNEIGLFVDKCKLL